MAAAGGIAIKKATADDLPDITFIHVTSWKEAYRGLIDQDYLDNLSMDARLSRWREGFAERQKDPSYALYMASVDGEPAGFIACGTPRDADMEGAGEILAAYVLARFYGQGIGYALYQEALRHFHDKDTLYLYVLTTNMRAQKAYRQWGGRIDEGKIKTQLIGTQSIEEYRVIFKPR